MVERAHVFLKAILQPGQCVIDATVGNGWDTLKLCEIVGESGKVYGFDIQEKAIQNTKQRLDAAGCLDRCLLYTASHDQMENYIKEPFHGFVMNLGYLPGSDKHVVTQAYSTETALRFLIQNLSSGGIGTVLTYYGHPGGSEEKQRVEEILNEIPSAWGQVLRIEITNRTNHPPILFVLEKK